jgi:hypothetical protein
MRRTVLLPLVILFLAACAEEDPTETVQVVQPTAELQDTATATATLTVAMPDVAPDSAIVTSLPVETPTPDALPTETAVPPIAPTVESLPSPSSQAIQDPGQESSADWPMFRLDLRHTGARGEPFSGAPLLKWQVSTGGTVESSPALVGDVVYVGTFNNALLALDKQTGDELWRFPVGGLLRASPSIVDGTIFFGADDNLFYAVDAATGSEKWRFPLGGGGEQSSPAVVDGVVYFGAFDRNVYALDVATGTEIWRFSTGAGILSSPFYWLQRRQYLCPRCTNGK